MVSPSPDGSRHNWLPRSTQISMSNLVLKLLLLKSRMSYVIVVSLSNIKLKWTSSKKEFTKLTEILKSVPLQVCPTVSWTTMSTDSTSIQVTALTTTMTHITTDVLKVWTIKPRSISLLLEPTNQLLLLELTGYTILPTQEVASIGSKSEQEVISQPCKQSSWESNWQVMPTEPWTWLDLMPLSSQLVVLLLVVPVQGYKSSCGMVPKLTLMPEEIKIRPD